MDSFFRWLNKVLSPYFNLQMYHLPELLMFVTGFILWAIGYYIILKNVRKYKFCQMPMIVAAGNIAWEFTWSFLFVGNLGPFFTWGCRLWFTMDLFINYSSIKYGLKDVSNPWLRKHYAFWYVFSLAGWFCIVYFMGLDHDDNELGVVSALLINVVMSALFIYQLLNYPQLRGKGMSGAVGICKMFGTGFISAGSFFIWYQNQFLITLGILSFIMDGIYVYLFYNYKNPELEAKSREEYRHRTMPV
jgi:hypothetical protein